jgi:hypothetical protein
VRELRSPPYLHQRSDVRLAQDRLDARNQRGSRGAFGVPVDVVEQDRRRHHAHVQIAFAVDQLVEALRAARTDLVFRLAQQERDQQRCTGPQLACGVERAGPLVRQQTFELGHPAIEGREVRPLVVVAVHESGERERLAPAIVGCPEHFIGTLDRRTAALRLDEDPCPAEPVGEPRIAFAHRRRQRFYPVRQRLRASLARPFERVLVNERAHRLPVAAVAKQRERLGLQSARRHEMAGAHGDGSPLLGFHPPCELVQEELAE